MNLRIKNFGAKNKEGGIGGLLDLRQTGQSYSYLYDGKGSVVTVLDNVQTAVAAYAYDDFGSPLSKLGTFEQPFRFSTEPYDETTGLVRYPYRFYAPSLGRWLSKDPIGVSGGLNLYAFVGNNPVNFIDPNGLWQVTIGAAYGYGGRVSFGENSGRWNVDFGLGYGLGAMASFTGEDTGRGYASRGHSANIGLGRVNTIAKKGVSP